MNSEYAEYLRSTYRMDDPPQLDNPVVNAISQGDRLYGQLFARDTSELFDPVRCPHMYEVARKAMQDLHAAMGELANSITPDGFGHPVFSPDLAQYVSRVRVDSHDLHPGDPFVPFSPDDAAFYVHFVGGGEAFAIRNPKDVDGFELAACGRSRARADIGYFRGLLQSIISTHREWGTTECNVCVSRECGGPTSVLPYQAGAYLLLFMACEPCLAFAEAAATTGRELSEMEARARDGFALTDPRDVEDGSQGGCGNGGWLRRIMRVFLNRRTFAGMGIPGRKRRLLTRQLRASTSVQDRLRLIAVRLLRAYYLR